MAGIEALLRGRVLVDRYRIEEVIGRGGMGAVYRATDERLGRPVAVKVITAATAGDPELRERVRARFRHEAAAAARLPHHPNVVPVYDYGTDPELGLDFIVMELLRGEDLATRLQKHGPPPLATSLRILREAARGVAVGHRTGVIHRDVKPGNVFLVEGHDGDELQVRVLDFGIAKVMADEDTQTALTQDGRAPLSPAYASPEQLAGEARLTPASDVFSLGALGFQLLTGEKPFTEADRNRMAVGVAVPVPSVRARNPAVPAEVEAVVRRALAPDPAERFPHAGACADAIDAVLRPVERSAVAAAVPPVAGAVVAGDADDDRTALAEDGGTVLAPPREIPRGAGPPAGPARPTPVIPPPRRRLEPERRGVPVLVWVLLALVLGAGGVLAYQSMNARGGPREDPLAGLPDSATKDTLISGDTLTPEDAPRVDRQGVQLLNAGDAPAAADLFRQAVELDPDRVMYRDHLAFALIRMGRYGEAAQLLEEAIRIDATYDLLYSHLADARLAMGDTAGAVPALERFVQVTLNQRDRQAAERRLAAIRAAMQRPVFTDTILIGPPPPPPPPPPPDSFPAPRDSIRIP
jgi:tRNA A-37 threonylcarbamoyl transferase component Bud32